MLPLWCKLGENCHINIFKTGLKIDLGWLCGIGEDGKVQGRFVSTGFVPRFVHDLEAKGIRLPKGIFAQAKPQIPRGR